MVEAAVGLFVSGLVSFIVGLAYRKFRKQPFNEDEVAELELLSSQTPKTWESSRATVQLRMHERPRLVVWMERLFLAVSVVLFVGALILIVL